MKTYSIIIVCLTLGIFYGLAVKLEHQKQLTQYATDVQSVSKNLVIADAPVVNKSQCSSRLLVTFNVENHGVFYDHNDEFSKQVTGKENRYLHTGISFIESHTSTREMEEVAMEEVAITSSGS